MGDKRQAWLTQRVSSCGHPRPTPPGNPLCRAKPGRAGPWGIASFTEQGQGRTEENIRLTERKTQPKGLEQSGRFLLPLARALLGLRLQTHGGFTEGRGGKNKCRRKQVVVGLKPSAAQRFGSSRGWWVSNSARLKGLGPAERGGWAAGEGEAGQRSRSAC